MDRIQFLVQGSADVPYKVTFQKDGNKLSAFCSCPAGENSQYCKHRLLILENIGMGVVSDNADQVAVVSGWLPGTSVTSALEAVASAEQELDRAKILLTAAKKTLAATMRA